MERSGRGGGGLSGLGAEGEIVAEQQHKKEILHSSAAAGDGLESK